jgi:trehalose 6-phosphate phosphatase
VNATRAPLPSFAHPAHRSRWALFLDVDGTLLQIALCPGSVTVPARTRLALQTAVSREAGAVALVSGRTIDGLDHLFAPLQLPVIGVHGLEWRDVAGRRGAMDMVRGRLSSARGRISRLVAMHPGLELEDKHCALAVHFRLAPHLEAHVREVLLEVARDRQPHLHLQGGKYCLELHPAPDAKRQAIENFMRGPPFAGRVPVYVGDDETDEQGFEAVNALGGLSIHVGNRPGTAARWQFANVNVVVHWLMSPGQSGQRAVPMSAPLSRHVGGRHERR